MTSSSSPNEGNQRIFSKRLMPKNIRKVAPELITNCSSQVEACARKILQHNIKLAKSCCLVVVTSTTSFAAPIILVGMQQVNFGENIIEAGLWCNIFYVSNSFMNCLIFFWKVAILRKEAKYFLKRLWLTILRKNQNI